MAPTETQAAARPTAQSVIDQRVAEAFADEANEKSSNLQYQHYGEDVPEILLPESILELKGLKSFRVTGVKIKNAVILARILNLEHLAFGSYHAPLPDLTFVGELKGLTFLELITGADIELSQVSDLPKLEHLIISNVQVNSPISIGSFSSLASFPQLKRLKFGNVFARNFEAIGHCKRLNTIGSVRTNCNTLSFAKGLQELKYLGALESPIVDISDLSGLPTLEELRLQGTRVKDISTLTSIPKLRILNLSDTLVEDVEPIGRCEALEEVDLSGSLITSLAGVARPPKLQVPGMTKQTLRKFNFANTRIFDLSPLAPEKHIGSLDVSGTDVVDLSVFANGLNIGGLSINDTRVENLGPKGCLSGVGYLYAKNTKILNVEALRGAKLTSLIIDGTRVSDLSPLRDVGGMKWLSIRDTEVEELSFLRDAASGVPDVHAGLHLDFEGTPISRKSDAMDYLSKIGNKDSCFIETKYFLTGTLPSLPVGISGSRAEAERKKALAQGADPEYALRMLEPTAATMQAPIQAKSIPTPSIEKAEKPNPRHVFIGVIMMLVFLGLLIVTFRIAYWLLI